MSATTMPRVALVVLTYNGLQYLPGLLQSIEAQTVAGLDVVVVDNASGDGTADYLERHRVRDMVVVHNDSNLGCAAGWNAGARRCRGADVVCLLNQDIVLDPGYAEAMQRAFRDDPGLGAVQPLVRCLGNPALVENCGHTADAWFTTQSINHLTAFAPQRMPRHQLFTLTAPAIDRRLFDELNGLDEELFIYYEDTDLSVRIWRAGRTVRFLATAVVDHDREAASRRLSDRRMTFLFARNRLRLLWKHADDPRGMARVVLMGAGMGVAGGLNAALSGAHGRALLDALMWNVRHAGSNRRARRSTRLLTDQSAWRDVRSHVLPTEGVLARLVVRLRMALARQVRWRWSRAATPEDERPAMTQGAPLR